MDEHGSGAPAALSSTGADVFDLAEALSRVEGDLDLLKELVDLFLEECPHMLEEVEQAVAAASPQALQHAAHTLKGSVGNFAASSAVAASFALEKMGRQQDLMNAPAALIKLKSEIERLIPVLAMVKEKEAA